MCSFTFFSFIDIYLSKIGSKATNRLWGFRNGWEMLYIRSFCCPTPSFSIYCSIRVKYCTTAEKKASGLYCEILLAEAYTCANTVFMYLEIHFIFHSKVYILYCTDTGSSQLLTASEPCSSAVELEQMNKSVNGWGLVVWILRDVITAVLWSGELGKGQSNWQVQALSGVPIKAGLFPRKISVWDSRVSMQQQAVDRAAHWRQPSQFWLHAALTLQAWKMNSLLVLNRWSIDVDSGHCVCQLMGLRGTVLPYKWMTSV